VGISARTNSLIDFFKNNGGIQRFSAIIRAGFHPDTLRVLEKNGVIEKMGRGIFRLVQFSTGSHPDLLSASLQAPRGVICLLSALSFHEVTNEIPAYISVAIPRGTHPNRISYPPVRFYRFSAATFKSGLEEYDIGGEKVRIYGIARTVADCFKFRSRIGINIAREALKSAVIDKRIAATVIMRYAKICRVDSIIKPILETII